MEKQNVVISAIVVATLTVAGVGYELWPKPDELQPGPADPDKCISAIAGGLAKSAEIRCVRAQVLMHPDPTPVEKWMCNDAVVSAAEQACLDAIHEGAAKDTKMGSIEFKSADGSTWAATVTPAAGVVKP